MGAGMVIGAVVAGTASIAGSTIFGATLAASVITGASLGRMFDKPKSASPTYSFGELDNTRAQRLAIPVTYGRVKVAGNIIYHRISDNEKELFMVVGLGEGEIAGVEDIRVNGEPITSIKGYKEHIVRLGTESQAAVSWVQTAETWPNTAYLACRFEASEDISMTPTITCIVKGRKVRAWSGGQWVTQYSNNPAWCILDLLTNERYGVGIKERYIDLESFKSEALYCDELVDDSKGGQEPRFRLDYNVDFQRSSLDLIDEILSTFRGYILYSDGKLRLQIEKSQVPVQSFTMDNIVADSFSYSKASLKEIPNQIRVEWIDPESDWEQSDMVYDNEVDQEERGEVLENAITLYGVTRSGQAGREARWYHDSGYICNTFCEFRVGIDSLHCEVGDIVKVSHDVPGWVEKQFRILEIQEEENDEMVLRCREYNSAIYHDRGSVYTQGRATELPNPNGPPASVTNLTVVERSKQLKDATWVPQALLSWDIPNDILYRAAHVYHSIDKGLSWQYVQRVADVTSYLMDVPLGENRFRVVSESGKGIMGDPGTSPVATITIVGKDTPPPNVEWSECSFITTIELNWNPVVTPDLQAYEVRVDQNWGNQTGLIYRGLDLSHIIEHPTQRSYTFYVKALDRSGNYSEQATPITLSLPAPPAPQQPTIETHFNAIKIWPTTLNLPQIQGYYIYVTKEAVTSKVPVLAGGDYTYPASSGVTVTIQVSAYDVIGEGGKSEPLQATTTNLSEMDLPEIPRNKLEQSVRDDIGLIPVLEAGFEDLANKITPLIVLSNESQSLITEYDGSITEQATLRTEIEVFLGKVRTAATIGNLVVRKLDGTAIGWASPTKSDPTTSTAGYVEWVIGVGVGLDADAGYIEIPIIVEDVIYTKRLMWTKARKGEAGTGVGEKGDPGDPAKLVDIIPSHLYFVGEDIGVGVERTRVYTPSIIHLELSLQHCEYSKWQYSLDGSTFADVSGQNGLSINTSTKSLSISATSTLYSANQVSLVFRVLTTTGQYDQVTISRIYNSEKMATEIRQTDDAVRIITKDLGEQASKVGQLEVRADGVDISVGSLEQDLGTAAAQIQTLADEITLKVQRKTNGELVVTGIGIGFDEQGQSIIPVLADNFVIQPTVESEGEYAFLVDTTKNPPEIYSPGKFTLGGLLRAPEIQAELIKTLLVQAELGVFDELRGLLMRADKLTVGGGVGGIPISNPKDSLVWHFDSHLHSTSGHAPEPDGSATLVGGGVYGGAVELAEGDTLTYAIPASTKMTLGAHIQIKE